jgi:REP element-mobilizing transposase RayT
MNQSHRHSADNDCYHVTTKTKHNKPLFQDAANAAVVMDALKFVRTDRAYLLGYVLMPDHLHAILVPRNGRTISSLMRTVKGYASRVINARRGGSGSLWQPSFHDRLIRSERQLHDTLEYMHWNPVRARLAGSPEEYPYSSACPERETNLGICLFDEPVGRRDWKVSAT